MFLSGVKLWIRLERSQKRAEMTVFGKIISLKQQVSG